MERLNIANCKQENIGSCRGCPVLNLVGKGLMRAQSDQQSSVIEHVIKELVIESVSKELCPEGKTLQIPTPIEETIYYNDTYMT